MGLNPTQNSRLADALRFNPRWWWDPVPDWIATQLDPGVLKQIATISIQFERNMLEQQMKALDQVQQLIGRG